MELEHFDSEEWNPPHEFEGYQLPSWPSEAFPEYAQRFVKEVSRSTETPIELASILFLSTLATVSMKNFYVEVHRSYQEPLALWTLGILPSGSRKSRVFEMIMAPIMTWEEQKRTQTQILTGPQISKKITLEEKVKHLRRKAAQTNNDSSFDEYQQQIELIEKEIDFMFTSPQLWTSDVTPEHLGTLMAQNDGATAILSDEGAIFDILGGLYSKGKANIDLLLKGHSGGSVKVDRGNRPPVHLERALISMGLAVQPEIIMNMCRNKTFRGIGLLGRFLYAFPVSNIGTRTNEEGPIDEAIQLHYNRIIGQVLNFQNTGNNPRYKLYLDPAAHVKWQEYSKSVEMMMSPEIGHLTHITDWASKLGGQIIRIAAFLHIYRHAFVNPEENRQLRLPNHGKLFKALMTAYVPSWREFDAIQCKGATSCSGTAKQK